MTVLFVTALLILPAGRAYGHVLQTDNDIGAILHIYPDDNPITGEPVNYILSFQDISRRFTLSACECFVTYRLDGTDITTKALTVSSELDSVNQFTFPYPGVYSIEVTGSPQEDSDFQSFKLTYTKRVASGDIEAQGMPVLLIVGITGIIGIILLAAYATELGSSNQGRKRKGNS